VAFLTWNQNYSVKVKNFDNQHQRLFDLINSLHDAMSTGKSNTVMGPIISELVLYTKTHFRNEEELFAKYNYPDRLKHVSQHAEFVKKISEFEKEFKNGKKGLSIEILNYLNKWLLEHIKQTDKAYSEFMNKNGIN